MKLYSKKISPLTFTLLLISSIFLMGQDGCSTATEDSATTDDGTVGGGSDSSGLFCFDMGDVFSEGNAHERPVHTVCLSSYNIDSREVTQAEFSAWNGGPPSKGYYFGGCDNCPAESVTWSEANAFCGAQGGQLPTEAQWEYAARGGAKVRYGNGANSIGACSTANFNSCLGSTIAGGTYGANSLGIYDMAGNVNEWVADWYSETYYSQSGTNNPAGPTTGTKKVYRGGSWRSDAYTVRATSRQSAEPTTRSFTIGFRCIR